MNQLRHALLAAALILLAPGSALASILFTANLTMNQETGAAGTGTPTTSTGAPRPVSFGSAILLLDDAQTALTINGEVHNIDFDGSQTTDINDNLTNAHIHAPAPPGGNAGVVWGFIGSPDHDDSPSDTVITPFDIGVGFFFSTKWDLPEGTGLTDLTDHLGSLLSGLAYLNFHTVQYSAGEIRGQIQPIPDSGASLLLLGLALTGLLAVRRRR